MKLKKNRWLRFYRDPAIGCPAIGQGLRFNLTKSRGFGVWMLVSGYWRKTLCIGIWWVIEIDRVEIQREATNTGDQR